MAQRRTGEVTRPARLGLVSLVVILLACAGLYFAVRYLRGNGGYRMGVRFASAAGLVPGSRVYLNGVNVGTVAKVRILPDATVEAVLDIYRSTPIPRDAAFSVRSSFTGSPTVAISAPAGRPGAASQAWPKRVLPISQQPFGVIPLSIEKVMTQAQALGTRASGMLARARPYGKRLASNLNAARTNASAAAAQLRQTPPVLMHTLSTTLAQAQANARRAQAVLRSGDRRKVAAIAAALQNSASQMQQASGALAALRNDPQMHANLRAAAARLSDAAQNLAGLSHDMQAIAGNPQTKAQLRDAEARLRAVLQKL